MVSVNAQLLPDCDQLELFFPRKYVVIPEPWEGQSPRGLTRPHRTASLGAPPAGGLRD